MEKKYKCGMVLSGGAVRGFAHGGVLKALNEYGIYPDVISGASAGSIVGVLYADGKTPDEINKIFSGKTIYKFIEFIMPNKGLVRMTGLYKMLKDNLNATTFEELKIPLYIAATNLNTAKCEYFSSGDLAKSVIASSSIPMLFTPVMINNIAYADGGMVNNLPIDPLIGLCDKIIGVNVNHVGTINEFRGLTHVADRCIQILLENNMINRKPLFDIYIEPEELNNYSLLDMKKHKEIFEIGYNATKKILIEKGL